MMTIDIESKSCDIISVTGHVMPCLIDQVTCVIDAALRQVIWRLIARYVVGSLFHRV